MLVRAVVFAFLLACRVDVCSAITTRPTFAPTQRPPSLSPVAPPLPTALRQVLIVAGNFTLDGDSVNLAEFDIANGSWKNLDEAELYLYGESNGVVLDLAVNHTVTASNKMFVVGSFDTVTKTSQVQYCSVGAWDGFTFEKVGEGLCPRGGDPSTAMHIQTTVIGSDGDIFVGGSFESRVWDGRHFVSVYHVAQFKFSKSSWLPLLGGQLQGKDEDSPVKVNSLAWDSKNSVLYIGGVFNAIGPSTSSVGLAYWSEATGLCAFPSGGLGTNLTSGNTDAQGGEVGAVAIAFEPISESLFVAGNFLQVNDEACASIAVWNKRDNSWFCLYEAAYSFLEITSMHLGAHELFLSGRAAPSSSWLASIPVKYAAFTIARLNVAGYISERSVTQPTPPGNHSNSISNSGSGGSGGSSGSDSEQRKRLHQFRRRQRHLLEQSFPEAIEKWHAAKEEQGVQGRLHHQQHHQGRSLRYNSKLESHPSNRSDGNIIPTISLLTIPNNSNKTSAANQTHIPTFAPTVPPPWVPMWSWLTGFAGTDGPVIRMTAGHNIFDGCLFIVGDFSNYPSSVLMWRYNATPLSTEVRVVGGKNTIQGYVTSVSQIYIPIRELPPGPSRPPKHQYEYTFFILFSCLLVGVILGAVFAFCFNSSSGYLRVKTDGDDSDMMISIPLKTLSGGAETTLDFKQSFERAMLARHLPTHEALITINPKEIVLSRIIGEGSFGRVWSGKWRNNSVAVKEFVFAQAAIVGGSLERHSIIEEIVGEAGIMACLRHPKILQLYGCSLTMQAIWIVSELCSVGSLRMLLNNKKIDLPFLKKISMCLDVADGMLYLHTRSPPIIHRDLKSHNLFITEPSAGHYVAKIGDWGSARAVALSGAKSMTQGVGTACWLAPEVINFAHSSKDSDVYAFGIVLWEVFTRQEVHEGLSAAQIIAKVANEGLRPQVPQNCPWKSIMTDCWKQDASERPGFHIIMTSLSKIYTKAKAANRLQNSADASASSTNSPGKPSGSSSGGGGELALNKKGATTSGPNSKESSLSFPAFVSQPTSRTSSGANPVTQGSDTQSLFLNKYDSSTTNTNSSGGYDASSELQQQQQQQQRKAASGGGEFQESDSASSRSGGNESSGGEASGRDNSAMAISRQAAAAASDVSVFSAVESKDQEQQQQQGVSARRKDLPPLPPNKPLKAHAPGDEMSSNEPESEPTGNE